MTTATDIRDALARYLGDEIECEAVNGAENRVECLTPLDYQSGDGISVWVESYPSGYVVTDYGESLSELLLHPPQDHKALHDRVEAICTPLGVTFTEGRLQTRAALDTSAEAIWRVATAASRISQAAVAFSPRRRQRTEGQFVAEVEHALRDRNVPVERERKLVGASGHQHAATIYVPGHEAILEPIIGNWNQVYAVYAKFGDLSRANGYALYSLLDDREGKPDDETARMLVQVSDVVEWSRRADWVGRLT
jgi:hypothetical protein